MEKTNIELVTYDGFISLIFQAEVHFGIETAVVDCLEEDDTNTI